MSAQMGLAANHLDFTAGNAAAGGTGAHTIAVLVNLGFGNSNMGGGGLFTGGSINRAVYAVNNAVFGPSDFTGGAGSVPGSVWTLMAVSKPAGAAPWRVHSWQYDAGGAGSFFHGVAAGAANHGDGAAADQIRIGEAAVASNGLYAVAGFWNVELSDGQIDTLRSNLLAAWAALSPAELIHLRDWNGTTGAVTAVGTSTFTGLTGTAGVGADPPSFVFDLGVTITDTSGGGGVGAQLDGLVRGDGSGGAGASGTTDGRVLGDTSAGAGVGSSSDTIATSVIITDSSGGGGTGGSPNTVVSGSPVVHDTMVMPILLQARGCMIQEVGKLQFPPARVQIRPGASFEFQVDANVNECCEGIAWIRRGTMTPSRNWPNQLADADKEAPSTYAVQLELGIMRCLPVAADFEGANVTEEQWLQAVQNAEDDAAALRRAICCLRDVYGNDSVIENPILPLENGGMCGGQVVTLLVRAPACDCVG